MSAKNLRRPILLLSLCGVLVACGKKDEPAPEPEPDKASEADEVGAGEGDEQADATGPDASAEPEGASVDDKGEPADGPGKVRRPPKDRLAGRRPPPLRKEPQAEVADAGAQGAEAADAGGSAEADATADPSDGAGGGDPPTGRPGATPTEPKPEVVAEPAKGEAPSDLSARPELAAGGAPTPGARAPQPAPAQPLYDVTRLLPLPTALELTQANNLTPAGGLAGIAASPSYGSLFYKAPSAAEYGVSVQAWHDPARRESDDRFRRMRLQYPNAEDVQVLAPVKAFFAQFGKIQMLTFVDSVKRVVVSLGCGEALCTHEELVKLAKAVRERL